MLNRVVLVGRLTRDPELRFTPNGVAVANFTLAVNRPFSNQQGEREADFINCVVWRKPAENVANFLKKGSLAGVDGRVQTRSYDNNEGKRVFITEVVAESVQFLEPRNSQNNQNQNFGGSQGNYGSGSGNAGSSGNRSNGYDNDPFSNDGSIDISDDDLPF
ncbi:MULTISPECIES: single-stranded DNA-binding protein [Shouchella]|uniref:Single-stranded DNA-binding protein n=2 Tax=Shouchella TaxID=2893057 RepID=A0ABY7WA26_9BACI|nr:MULTISPECIES: single-stranded DNA-binding protein [Shouchella]MED4129851.1 single-stranded DNA-binding protein [Shouchella miscanthi]WDF05304.1 single-stranded DNA-binding protein [Shouchella hunanensis]GAF23289.1 single-stranded DNA-binding protein [Bacillus sp. JCM 19047]